MHRQVIVCEYVGEHYVPEWALSHLALCICTFLCEKLRGVHDLSISPSLPLSLPPSLSPTLSLSLSLPPSLSLSPPPSLLSSLLLSYPPSLSPTLSLFLPPSPTLPPSLSPQSTPRCVLPICSYLDQLRLHTCSLPPTHLLLALFSTALLVNCTTAIIGWLLGTSENKKKKNKNGGKPQDKA